VGQNIVDLICLSKDTLPSFPSRQGRGGKEGVSNQGKRSKILSQESLKNLKIKLQGKLKIEL